MESRIHRRKSVSKVPWPRRDANRRASPKNGHLRAVVGDRTTSEAMMDGKGWAVQPTEILAITCR